MRRHFRNHARPGFSRPHPSSVKDLQRRRRRLQLSASGQPINPSIEPLVTTVQSSPSLSPPITSLSEDSDEEAGTIAEIKGSRRRSRFEFEDNEQDELLEDYDLWVGSDSPRQLHKKVEDNDVTHYRDSPEHQLSPPSTALSPRHHTRDARSRSKIDSCKELHSPSSPRSPVLYSAQSPRAGYIYTPSSAYARSCTDPRVSTLLRPAFKLAAGHQPVVKEEMVTWW